MARVDVIIPAFNVEAFIAQAIESVINQTFTDWRIIVVDRSSDRTPEIVASYRQRLGSKLEYLVQTNKGLAAARNIAINNSSSEYVAILDADDIWLPERLAKSAEALDQHPEAGLAHTRVAHLDAAGKVVNIPQANPALLTGRIASRLYRREIHLQCPTITFRRSCLKETGLFDESLRATEDRDMWLRIAERYPVVFIDEILAHYRLAPNSLSQDPERMLDGQLAFINKHYGKPGCGFWARRSALSSAYCEQMERYLRLKRPKSAAVVPFVRSVYYAPQNLRTAFYVLRSTNPP